MQNFNFCWADDKCVAFFANTFSDSELFGFKQISAKFINLKTNQKKKVPNLKNLKLSSLTL